MFNIGDLVCYVTGVGRQIGRIVDLDATTDSGCVWRVETAPGLSQFFYDHELSVVKG